MSCFRSLLFGNKPKSAAVAKGERLQLIIAHERSGPVGQEGLPAEMQKRTDRRRIPSTSPSTRTTSRSRRSRQLRGARSQHRPAEPGGNSAHAPGPAETDPFEQLRAAPAKAHHSDLYKGLDLIFLDRWPIRPAKN